MGHKPSTGTEKQPPTAFARDLLDYLSVLRGKTSVRAIARLGPDRGVTWWAEVFRGAKILTTNDVQMIADMLGVSAYDFVRNARRLSRGEPYDVYSFDVGPSAEDYEISEAPDESLPAAAERFTRKGERDEGV